MNIEIHFLLLSTPPPRMSTMEEELQARYGTQRIESDEDEELLGGRDDEDSEIDVIGDDVMMMSSKYEGDPASPPIGVREEVVDYQYNESELDYDEMLDMEQIGRSNPPSRKQQQVHTCIPYSGKFSREKTFADQ